VADKAMGVKFRKWRVRESMEVAGYKTIDALADDLEVSRQALTTAINGHSQPTLGLALAVAKALGIHVEDIVEQRPELDIPKGGGRSSKALTSMVAPLLVDVG
jgi:DNA-binding XRE family transcriptional regulator